MTYEENPDAREPELDADARDADSDPASDPASDQASDQASDPDGARSDVEDDPAHSADEDEGWTSEGGATPSGPATEVDPDA